MPRIRTIKPEFFGDEKLAPMAVIDRFVFVGLVSFADDAGRLVDNVKAIDGFIFPESGDTSRESLMRLSGNGRILRYVSPSGQPLIQIVNWKKHQKIQHPSKYVLPGPPRASSRNTHEDLQKPSGLDLNHHTNDHGPTTMDHGPSTNDQSARATDMPTAGASDGAIAGSIGGEPVSAAIELAKAANRGITQRWGEQPNPISPTKGSSIEAVEMLRSAGVPIAFACDAMLTWLVHDGQTADGRPPNSLKYLAKVVIPRWQASQLHQQATTSGAKVIDTPASGSDVDPFMAAAEQQRAQRLAGASHG